MARFEHQTCPPPLAMASARDPGDLPITRARSVVGFLPARNARLRMTPPLQRILQTDTDEPVTGVAYYYNPQPPTQAEFNAGLFRRDRLIVVKNGVNLHCHTVAYDASTQEMSFGSAVYVGDLLSVKNGGLAENQNIRTVQYRDEMFIVAGDGSTPMRFYLDPPSDTPRLYRVGIASPAAAVTPVAGAAGNVNGTVTYYHTEADAKGRESSPSASASVTVANKIVNLTFAWGTDAQITTKYIYRTTDGGIIPYRIATITNTSTTTYADNALDSSITSNAQMPAIGSNEPPNRASALELHKTHLFLNDRSIYDDPTDTSSLTRLQMSNLDAPTQFNVVPDPDDASLGIQQRVGNRDSDELTGLKSNGSILAICSRSGMHHLYGDGLDDFQIRYQHDIGCVSIDSLTEGDGWLYYLGEDGIYATMFADGFLPRKLSLEIDNVFNGSLLAYSNVG